jgi:hypothetical protein
MTTLLNTKQISHEGTSLHDIIASAIAPAGAFSTTYDPVPIPAGSSIQSSFTVSGATVGQAAIPTFSVYLGTAIMTAQVTAANTVIVTIHNRDSVSLNLGSGTLRIKLL